MEPLDPQIKALATAIKRQETGGSKDPYNTKGPSGEFGAYQFMPETWKAWSAKHLGDANAPMTVENQNRVAYNQVKEWKTKGYNPAQIAAAWNAGEGKVANDAWKSNVGVNEFGVQYDTPNYVKKVSQYYRELNNSQPGQTQQEQVIEPPKTASQFVLGEVGSALKENIYDPYASRLGAIDYKNQGIVSDALQTTGAVIGGTLDIFGKGLLGAAKIVTPKPIENAVEGGVKQTIGAIASLVPEEAKVAINDWATQHPEASANLNALLEVASVIPVGKGFNALKTAVTSAGRAEEATNLARRITQATPVNIERTTPMATRTLSNVPIESEQTIFGVKLPTIFNKNVKTYKQLEDAIQKEATKDLEYVTNELKKDTTRYSANDFVSAPAELLGKKFNPVTEAISSLSELGSKTNNISLLNEVGDFKVKLARGEFTKNDVNELAKLVGKNSKSFRDNGQLLKNTNAVKAENTRNALKEIARDGMSEELKARDIKVSEAIMTKTLVSNMKNKVLSQIQKESKVGVLSKMAGVGVNLADLLTGRLISGAMYRIARNAGIPEAMKAVELEKELLKNLKRLQEINKTGNMNQMKNFIQSVGYIGAGVTGANVTEPKE